VFGFLDIEGGTYAQCSRVRCGVIYLYLRGRLQEIGIRGASGSYSSQNIIRVSESRRKRWRGHATRKGGGEKRDTKFFRGKRKERDKLEDLGIKVKKIKKK